MPPTRKLRSILVVDMGFVTQDAQATHWSATRSELETLKVKQKSAANFHQETIVVGSHQFPG